MKRWRVVGLVILALAVLGGLAFYLTRRDPLVTLPKRPPKKIVISGVQLLDVEKGETTGPVDIIVDGSTIASIEPHDDKRAANGAHVIDGNGLTAVPGLVDVHCHLMSDASPPWDRGLPDTDLNLERLLFSGVTTAFDPGAMTPDIFELREALRSGERLGPNTYAAGPIFTGPGGHPIPMVKELAPSFLVDRLVEGMTRQIETEEQARDAVAEVALLEPDFIKLAIDRIPMESPRLDPDMASAIVREAKSHGLRTVAHIGTTEDAIDSGEAGVAAWVHGVYKERIKDEDIQRLAAFEIPMVPTMVVFRAYADMGRGDFPPTALERQVATADYFESRATLPEDWETSDAAKAFAEHLVTERATGIENVRRLAAAGVTMLAGSDAQSGTIHGPALHRELALLSEAGLSNIDVLRAATLEAARFLEDAKEPSYGVLSAGKRADVVLVRGDPLADLAALSDIETGIVRGQLLNRHPLE